MAGNKRWSEQRKEYIRSLIPNKRILFAIVNGAPKIYWEQLADNYDIIVGLSESDYYIVMNANLHNGCKSAVVDCISEFTQGKKIEVGIRKRSGERVLFVPSCKIEEFFNYFSYYMEKYKS